MPGYPGSFSSPMGYGGGAGSFGASSSSGDGGGGGGDLLDWLKALGPLAGGLIGGINQGNSDAAANALREKLLAAWQGLKTPDVNGMRINPKLYGGKLSPQLLGKNAMNELGSSQGRGAQSQALDAFRAMLTGGGNDAQSLAKQRMAEMDAANYEKSQRDALFNRMGPNFNGGALMSALSGQQQGSNRSAMTGMQAASDAAARRMNAAESMGNVGSEMMNQDQRAAMAQNQIDYSNAMMSNYGQEYNLGRGDRNTDIENYAQQYNSQLPQQDYLNQLNKLRGMGGASGDFSQGIAEAGKDSANFWGGLGQTAGNVAGGMQDWVRRRRTG